MSGDEGRRRSGHRASPEIQWFGLNGPDHACRWCRTLLVSALPARERPDDGAPHDQRHPACPRCRAARRLERARALMLPLSALVTVAAAVATIWRR